MTVHLSSAAVDLRHDRRLDRDAARVFVSASLIKLPILISALEQVDDGVLQLTDQLTILDEHRVGGSGWLTDRRDLTTADVGTLLTAMIDSSDNCATNVILDRVGHDAVNGVCRRLGLGHTVLRRAMMDAAARRAGRENLTSAVDMSTLLEQLARGAVLSDASRGLAVSALLGQRTTGRLDHALPAGYRLAHKTGELDGIRHDAGIVLDDDGPRAVLAVLTDGEPDEHRADRAIRRAAREIYGALGL